MRKIILNRKLEDNTWTLIDSDYNLSAGAPEQDLLVSLETWEKLKDQLSNHQGRIGLEISGEVEPENFVDQLDKFAMIAIVFPKFADGRGYSLARLLRERYGYGGELRAKGDVLRDQLFYLQRCGFNAFEIREDRCVEDALNAFEDFTVTYQADANEKRPIYHRHS